ncbi:CidA/LrgA family protein [Bacillus mangrovi]|uniref:CidA/LrgA family protein n=2 Tax=Metabacillus mangrovi TaxID=1491830 RepID=A0A7X2S8G8_9BACI|nr:CidA/LrgA family protein [Metabacillus mangrovi]
MQIVFQTAILFGFSALGAVIQKAANLQIPGSIIGMLLLFLFLRAGWIKPVWIKEGSSFLLNYLTLLFVPGTVGLVQYLHLFEGRGALSLAAALISTFFVMAASSLLAEKSLSSKREEGEMNSG